MFDQIISIQHRWADALRLLFLGLVIHFVCGVVYNLYLHPLCKFPGPWLARASNVSFSYWFHGGRQPYKILDLHLKYGPVVRVAPNDLVFNSAQAWQDIYGFRPGHRTFIKGVFYEGGVFSSRGVSSIDTERDPQRHANMRRLLANAFSMTSLTEQEELVRGTIDRFIEVFKTKTVEHGQVFDVTKGYERMTFDIIGDLAFGETFGALESETPHPWVESLLSSLNKGALNETSKRFPAVAKIAMFVFHKQISKLFEAAAQNAEYAIKAVEKRVQKETNRKDFFTRILEQRDNERHKVSDLELAAHAWDFVAAGSETTATAMSTVTFYVLRNPDIMAKLKAEVRGAFTTASAINNATATPLRYLDAVCREAMRMYPPLPFALPRLVPKGGDTIDGQWVPGGTAVSIMPTAASLDLANFSDPYCFKPERWLEVDKSKDALEASQPFSLGARGCIGVNLAWMELRITLALVFWTFDLELDSKCRDLDWHRDSEMHSLWQKPQLLVRAQLAKHVV
ncbi:cytochrome P450 [Xylariaceae sp. AK1471]|nr:cytochrome P450 [Xylariaceae sp. AK1471]